MTDDSSTLAELRREAQTLVSSVKDYAIFMLDRGGCVLTWNEGARAIKRYEPEEIIGQHFARFYTPEDIANGKPMRLLGIAAAEGRVEDEGWRVRKDGSRFWADVVITALRGESGRLLGFAKVTRDLTLRQEAEEALRRSEQDLSATLYSIADGVIATDEKARITRMNPVAEHLTGWLQSEALGRSVDAIFKIVSEKTRAPAKNPVQRVIAEGLVIGLANHTALISRDGAERPIADSGAPIRDASGTIRGAVLVFRDVSQERRAEEALRQSEEKLRLMIASVRDYAFFMLDPKGMVASWNAGAESIKGYRSEEIIGSHFSRFYPAKDLEAGKPGRELEAAVAEGRFEDEGWRVRKDGSRFWANVVISPIRDDAGTLVGFTKVTRDMSERRRAEQELAHRSVQHAAIAQLGVLAVRVGELQPLLDAAVGLAATTLGTEICKVLELQPESESLLLRAGVGWKEGLVGRATVLAGRDSLPGFTLSSHEPVVVGDLSVEKRFSCPAILRENGVVSGVALVIPLLGEDRPYGVFGAYATRQMEFSRDDVSFLQAIAHVIATAISRMRAEEQLRSAERAAGEERERTARAEEAVRERDVFLSVAAHELRTPLTALQLKLQGLEQVAQQELSSTSLASKAKSRLQDALRQTNRLAELVERLLDVSRIAAGRLEIQPEPLELESVVRAIVCDSQENASESRTEIRAHSSGDTRGEWDRGRLEQVVLNLVSNAVKYGEGRPVEVAIQGGDSEVRLTVADRGIGIAVGDLERIFKPFERAAPIQHFAGLGLGLHITRHIVEAHGGKIDVASKPGEGTTFTVTLPKVPLAKLTGSLAREAEHRA